MSLYQQIKTEQLEARKAKIQLQINLYTTLLGEIQNATTGNKGSSSEITDSEVLKVINKFIKNAKESLKLKPDNVTVSLELKILETFLPKQLSNEENIYSYSPCPVARFGYLCRWNARNHRFYTIHLTEGRAGCGNSREIHS